jgi:hypothetical protein
LWKSIVAGVHLLAWNGTSFSQNSEKGMFADSSIMPAENFLISGRT